MHIFLSKMKETAVMVIMRHSAHRTKGLSHPFSMIYIFFFDKPRHIDVWPVWKLKFKRIYSQNCNRHFLRPLCIHATVSYGEVSWVGENCTHLFIVNKCFFYNKISAFPIHLALQARGKSVKYKISAWASLAIYKNQFERDSMIIQDKWY